MVPSPNPPPYRHNLIRTYLIVISPKGGGCRPCVLSRQPLMDVHERHAHTFNFGAYTRSEYTLNNQNLSNNTKVGDSGWKMEPRRMLFYTVEPTWSGGWTCHGRLGDCCKRYGVCGSVGTTRVKGLNIRLVHNSLHESPIISLYVVDETVEWRNDTLAYG